MAAEHLGGEEAAGADNELGKAGCWYGRCEGYFVALIEFCLILALA